MKFLKYMEYICISLLCIYLAIIALVYFNQRSLLYHPGKQNHELSFYNIDSAEELFLTTKDNIKLQVWYRKSKDKMAIFLHGNVGDLENRADKLKQLAEMGYGFIIPAWRGFGKSEGVPSEEGLYIDAEKVIEYLQKNGYDLSKVIMIGESLGTGIATKMACKYKFKGLFLITPYTSIAERAAEIYPYLFAKYLTKDNFKVLENIDKINQPLFMIHGDKDTVVPYEHSKKIFARAKETKKLIIYPGVGHVNYNVKDVFEQMDRFFFGSGN